MKLTKITALALALVLCFALLTSCSLFDLGDTDGVPSDDPKELYRYAAKYMQEHAYKQTVVSMTYMDGELEDTTTEVTHYEGDNYYMGSGNGMLVTYYDNVVYVSSANGKKKMNMTVQEFADMVSYDEDYDFDVINDISDDDITFTKNDDGTSTINFVVEMPYIGPMNYSTVIDSKGRITEYTIDYTMTALGMTVRTVQEITVEYGDQYKVYAPADAAEYELVGDYRDLVGY